MSAPHLGPTATQGSPLGNNTAPDAAGRRARIEQLLLSGLDHYFAGRYEQAIDIWTRVVFLERRHGRARAYIERARSALAERQRESDELVHRGREAYQQGRVDAARALLTEAVARQGPSDTAQVLLQRLGRLEPVIVAQRSGVSASEVGTRDRSDPARVRWLPTVLACAVAVAVVAALASPLISVLTTWPIAGAATSAAPRQTLPGQTPPGQTVPRYPLPVAEPSEGLVRHARSLHAAGRSKEALRVLETVRLGDPLRPEVDQLRAGIAASILTTMRSPAVEPRR